MKGQILTAIELDQNFQDELILLGYGVDPAELTTDRVSAIILTDKIVIIDTAEPTNVVECFVRLGFKIKREPINLDGHRAFDFLNEERNAGGERKTVEDFKSSMNDDRLWLQLTKMYYSNVAGCLIIVGPHFDEDDIAAQHRILGAMASIGANYRIPVYHVKDEQDAAYLATRFMEKAANRKVISSSLFTYDKDLKKKSQQLALMTSIEKIGLVLGKLLLNKFGSPLEVAIAARDRPKEMMKIKGVGDKTVERIRNAFEDRYVEVPDLWSNTENITVNVGNKEKKKEEKLPSLAEIQPDPDIYDEW